MSDSYRFNTDDIKLGPADDCRDGTSMRVNIAARKTAFRGFTDMIKIIKEHSPECSGKEGINYQWQGTIALASYSLALTQAMLTRVGWEWKKGEEPKLEVLGLLIQEIARKHLEQMEKTND